MNGDVHVCAKCFEDQALKDFVEGSAEARCCDFCGAKSKKPIVAPLEEVVRHIRESLDREYDDAANVLPYESAEGGYQGETWTTQELLEESIGLVLPNDDDGELMEALCDGLGDQVWCERDPYSLSDSERLSFSWDQFCELVKHRRHYFFLREERKDDELYTPLTLLKELAKWCKRFELIKTLPMGTLLYRARYEEWGKSLSTAADLGPPPEDKATMSNRMSPPGVVMFYVSENGDTALRETAKNPKKDAGWYAIGKFKTLREMKILDLADVPPIPSIFQSIPESLEYDPRPPTIFLNYFARELSKPIARDRSIHVEYIPTQVITEYFRTEFVHEGQEIDGIRYRSARHAYHRSLVLFATQDDVVGGEAPDSYSSKQERWIELVTHKKHHVSTADLKKWEKETPIGFEWI